MELTLAVSDLLVMPYAETQAAHGLTKEFHGVPYVVSFRLPTAGDVDRGAVLALVDTERAAREVFRACLLSATRDGFPVDADELPEEIQRAVSTAMSAKDPQAELELELRCPACGTAFSAVFDTASFLLRELDERATQLLNEVHALALSYHWSETDIVRMPRARRRHYLELLANAQVAAAR
jgi:hypothetical protein